MTLISCTYPLELVHLDFLTIGKERSDKNVNIVVITNHFMWYSQAFITLKLHVWPKHCGKNFLVHYRWPEKIITDQGKSFKNHLIKELCELAEVQKLCTTPYRPQTNDNCEWFNETLINMLGTLPPHAKKS